MSIDKEAPNLQDFSKTFKQRFLSIRIEEPNRANCIWKVGLTDDSNQFKNSFECSSTGDANNLLEYIVGQGYTNLQRGEDYGTVSFRKVVYLFAEERNHFTFSSEI